MAFKMSLIFLVCLLAIDLVMCEPVFNHSTYCVRAAGNVSCNASLRCKECQPLMWFVNHTQTISNNSEMIFQPGVHYLNSTTSEKALMNFTNKNDLKLIGMGRVDMDPIDKTPLPTSRVVCNNEAGFFFQISTNVEIHGLTFRGCGVNVSIRTSHFSLRAAVFFHTSYDITISEVLIEDSPWFGLHMDNICGDITITDSAFTKSNSGNAVFWFKHCQLKYLNATNLSIEHSFFLHGYSTHENSTGLYLFIYRPAVHIKLNHTISRNNTGVHGGNIGIKLVDFARDTSHVRIHNSIMEYGHAENSGGGLLMWFEKNNTKTNDTYDCGTEGVTRNIVKFKNTTFRRNTAVKSGGAVRISFYERSGTGCTIRDIKFSACTFLDNSAKTAAALQIAKHQIAGYKVHNTPQFAVSLKSCLITQNHLTSYSEQENEDGIMDIFSIEKITIKNTTFSHNNGTALLLVNSGVVFTKINVFEGNVASYGGAIKLCDTSLLYLGDDTRVIFKENKAEIAGGAIYAVDQYLHSLSPACFFQPVAMTTNVNHLKNDTLHFENNTAMYAGSDIYGGAIDSCFTYSTFNSSFYNSLAVFEQITNIDVHNQVSHVTSAPYGVCVCDPSTNKTNCSVRKLSLTERYAGQDFTISVSAVGQTNGSVPASISIELPNQKNASVNITHYNFQRTVNMLCQPITLAAYSREKKEVEFKVKVHMSNPVSERPNYYKLPKLIITVPVIPCPAFFELNKRNSCDCNSVLKDFDIKCDINTMMVRKPRYSVWIGCESTNKNSTTQNTSFCENIEGSRLCQEDRCSQKMNLTIPTLDDQCVKGRTGRLCGHCETNYSLSLGALTCVNNERCSIWKSLLLVLVFLLAGILFFCFLAIFNFTITEGTVNGLLFYASSIQSNQDYFFPHNEVNNSLKIFISWLNLDLGFQVCFYEGMTAYQKIWLEFAFLFYLFFLGSLIVVLSHKFIWFTRLAGRKVVPVISTIIVFAYPKLIRNLIKVFACSREIWRTDHRNVREWIWKEDETMNCFEGWHIPLFVFAIVMCTIATLYTQSLLFIQCLQRRSNWCVLRWVNRLRPFFDANTGPCRDHYRFWPGFLLFVRFGVYVCNLITDKGSMMFVLSLFCTLLFILACVTPNGVYKKWPLNLLEFAFFLNLAIISGLLSHVYYEKQTFYKDRYILSDISVGIAAAMFSCILLYHSYKRVSGTRRWSKVVRRFQRQRNNRGYDILPIQGDHQRDNNPEREIDERTPLSGPRRMPPVFRFDSPREPLLEDD